MEPVVAVLVSRVTGRDGSSEGIECLWIGVYVDASVIYLDDLFISGRGRLPPEGR